VDAHSVILVYMHRAPETYIHRVGRTGRFGAEGIAVSLVANNQVLASFPPSLPPFFFLPSSFSLPSPRIVLPVLVVIASFHHASGFRPSGLLLPLLPCRNGISCAPLNETTLWASRHRLVRKPVRTKGNTSKGGRSRVGQHGTIIAHGYFSLCVPPRHLCHSRPHSSSPSRLHSRGREGTMPFVRLSFLSMLSSPRPRNFPFNRPAPELPFPSALFPSFPSCPSDV